MARRLNPRPQDIRPTASHNSGAGWVRLDPATKEHSLMRLMLTLSLMLFGCDALLSSNPKNCIQNPRACTNDQVCNPETQSCQARSCRSSPTECLTDQFCDPASKLCIPLDCVTAPSQCGSDQRCNSATRRCETVPFVLGQPDMQINLNAAYGMNGPQGVLLVPDPTTPGQSKLLVADRGNRRVLIWNSVPSSNRPADAVLGMPDVHTLSPNDAYGGINEASLLAPSSLSSSGGKLAVADTQANRVLFWNQIPSAIPNKGPIPANSLWGQNNFQSAFSDSPTGQTNSLGVFGPGAAFTPQGGRFYIPDQFNHRVLAFVLVPTSAGSKPIAIIGQATTDTAVRGLSASALNQPTQVSVAGIELLVADSQNHRILVFDASSNLSNPSALAVLGQASFIEGLPNRSPGFVPPPAANTLYLPTALHAMETPSRLLWVADTNNHRVLRFTLPAATTSNLSADLVLGQPDFTQRLDPSTTPPSAGSLFYPSGVHSDGTRLVVSDSGANRVLLWNSLPTTNQQPADVVLGQPDAVSTRTNNPLPPQPLQFNQVSHVATDGTRLFVADQGNHRVLIWNQIPKQGPNPPDVVLGQPNFTTALPNGGANVPTSSTLFSPSKIAVAGGRLAVADRDNHRVLVWNSIPTQNGASASACIGQISCGSRTPAEAASRLNAPAGVALTSTGALFVADQNNSRVVWYPAGATTGTFAIGVVGQTALQGGKGANAGGQSAATLSLPGQVLVTPTQLLVADTGNHRVLLWQTLPTSPGKSADVVIGQNDFGSSYTRASRSRLESPSDLLLRDGALYVSSSTQHRILIWSALPTQNGQPADLVIGQPDFGSSLPNHPELTLADRLNAPVGLAAAGNQLYVAERVNNRVSVHRPLP